MLTPYEPPELRELGSVSVLTSYDSAGLHFAQATLGSLPGGPPGGQSPHNVPPPPGQGVLGSTESGPSGAVPGGSGVEPFSSPGGHHAGGGPDVVSEHGAGGGRLPFTGFPAAIIGSVGAAVGAAGAALRRWTRRA